MAMFHGVFDKSSAHTSSRKLSWMEKEKISATASGRFIQALNYSSWSSTVRLVVSKHSFLHVDIDPRFLRFGTKLMYERY